MKYLLIFYVMFCGVSLQSQHKINRIIVNQCDSLYYNNDIEFNEAYDNIKNNGYYDCDCVYIPQKYYVNGNIMLGLLTKDISVEMPVHTGEELISTDITDNLLTVLYVSYYNKTVYRKYIVWKYDCENNSFSIISIHSSSKYIE